MLRHKPPKIPLPPKSQNRVVASRNKSNNQSNGRNKQVNTPLVRLQRQLQSLRDSLRETRDLGESTEHMMRVAENAARGRSKLVSNSAGYSWRGDGNVVTSDFADFPEFQTSDYNVLYAEAGGPTWPVPKPVTNPESASNPYASNVGCLTLTRTYKAGDLTEYIVITACPESTDPITSWQMDAKDTFYYPAVSSPKAPTYKTRVDSNWIQMEPRLMITGQSGNSRRLQQHMGGEIRFDVSVPWDSTASVATLDPLIAPSVCGNKLPHARQPIVNNADSKNAYYYYELLGHSEQVTAGELYAMGSTRVVLNGGGTRSNLSGAWRTIPNSQDWSYMTGEASPAYPGPWSACPVVIIELPPYQTVSVSLAGWLAYNVQLDPTTPVGALLAQDAPICTPHMSAIKNVPMTIVSVVDGSAVAEMPYVGMSLNHSLTTSNSIGNGVNTAKGRASVQNVLSSLGSLASRAARSGGTHLLAAAKTAAANPHVRAAGLRLLRSLLARASQTLVKAPLAIL